MSIGALSNATALTILTTTYSPAGGQTTRLSKGDGKALATDPLLASLGSSDFFFVGRASQNAVMTTIVNTGRNKAGVDSQTLKFYESSIQQAANVFLADNQMTSQQISDAIYSGQGIATTDPFGVNPTIADEITALTQGAASDTQFASDLTAWEAAGKPNNAFAQLQTDLPNLTDAQLSAVLRSAQNSAASESMAATGISAAFNNHTLTIQKATDVQGLDYNQTIDMTSEGNEGTTNVSQSYNKDFLKNADADGKHHALDGVLTGGNVTLYLTW
jgi:hypothetical protein